METSNFLTLGNIGGLYDGIYCRFLRVTSIGRPFVGRYGELKGQRAVVVEFEQISRVGNEIVRNDILKFKGIKSYLPVREEGGDLVVGDIVDCGSGVISKQFGVDLFGAANINFKYLKKVSENEVTEKTTTGDGGKWASEEARQTFLRAVEDVSKVYKYNAVKRYLTDPQLREKYSDELGRVDEVYQGPGAEYKYEDLVKEIEDNPKWVKSKLPSS